MANNRMYLKCSCGSLCYLGKRMGSGYYFHEGAMVQDELGKFYDEHEWCPGGLDHFSISYECPPNYDHGPGYEVERHAPCGKPSPDGTRWCTLETGHSGEHRQFYTAWSVERGASIADRMDKLVGESIERLGSEAKRVYEEELFKKPPE
jgi:hypothetical protein